MKLNMKEKKILYAYACPSHHNTVTRLKWLTALTVDPEAKSQMLHLARKIETETEERWYEWDFSKRKINKSLLLKTLAE